MATTTATQTATNGSLATKVTDNAIFFYGHSHGCAEDCYSQFFSSKFIEPALENLEFISAEQYMMAMKAKLMRDEASFDKIMASTTPAQAKDLGRQVQGFNQQIWDVACDSVVERGNWLKFGQNEKLAEQLLSTGDKQLVEASPSDKIWGIGYSASEAEGNEATWGANKLGKALMRVRQRIRSGEKEGDWPRVVKIEGCTDCGCGQKHQFH